MKKKEGYQIQFRSSLLEVFYKKDVLRKLKKETLAQVFYCKFCEISKNIFSYRTPPIAASYRFLQKKDFRKRKPNSSLLSTYHTD